MNKYSLITYISITCSYAVYELSKLEFSLGLLLHIIFCLFGVISSLLFIKYNDKYLRVVLLCIAGMQMFGYWFPKSQYIFHSLLSVFITIGISGDDLSLTTAINRGGIDIMLNFGGAEYVGYYFGVNLVPFSVLMFYHFMGKKIDGVA